MIEIQRCGSIQVFAHEPRPDETQPTFGLPFLIASQYTFYRDFKKLQFIVLQF